MEKNTELKSTQIKISKKKIISTQESLKNQFEIMPRKRRIQIGIQNKLDESESESSIHVNKVNETNKGTPTLIVKNNHSKKIKKKRSLDSTKSYQIRKLKKCNSKIALRRILLKLSPEWKKIIKFYMTDCFINDLYTRRLANKKFLLSKRELLFKVIDSPELLTMDCHFDNNLLKNYCTGIANFVNKHYQDIKKKLNLQL